jgi:hypothetical protein
MDGEINRHEEKAVHGIREKPDKKNERGTSRRR